MRQFNILVAPAQIGAIRKEVFTKSYSNGRGRWSFAEEPNLRAAADVLETAMSAKHIEAGGSIVPTLRYRDVAAAIDWLCNAFGFERQLVVDDADGGVRYAELTFGTGMVMVGPVEGAGTDATDAPPAESGAETQVCYLFVADAAGHCARAKAAGAEIVLDIDDEESRGRGYSCRDPEGHVWTFGTYNPWKGAHRVHRASRSADSLRAGVGRLALGGAIVGIVIASAAVAGWALGLAEFHSLDPEAPVGVASDAGMDAARTIREMRQQLAREQGAREHAERAAAEAQAQLVRERRLKEAAQPANAAADRALEEARGQLARERSALAAAQRMAEDARERVSLAERSAKAASDQLAAERSARQAAEQTRQQVQDLLTKERAAWAAAELEAEAEERAETQQRAKEIKRSANYRVRPPPTAPALRPRPAFRPYATWDH